MSVKFERVVKEDLNIGYGYTTVTMPAGGTAIGTKIGLHTFTGHFNVKDFGAVGDGSVDDTAAIQATIDAALGVTTGGVVLFPPGTYNVTELDLHNTSTATITQSLTLRGAGRYASAIRGTKTGAILVDALGRSYLTIEDLRLTTDGTAIYQTALLLARRTGGAVECRQNAFTRLRIDGDYSVGSAVAIASEGNVWSDVELCNDNATNGRCCFFTGLGNSVANISTPHGTILESTNTFNLMNRVTWYAPYNNATPVIMDQGAGYNMVGCSVQIGNFTGVKCVTYLDRGTGPGGGFVGPVNWYGTLWECASDTVHYLRPSGITPGYFQFITDIGSSFTLYGASTAQYAMKTDGSVCIVNRCTITGGRFVGGTAGTLNITVDEIAGCDFDIWSPAFDSTITVLTKRSVSRLKAKTLTIPAAETDYPSLTAQVETDDVDLQTRTLGVGVAPAAGQIAKVGGS
jgi:hypothetical protein